MHTQPAQLQAAWKEALDDVAQGRAMAPYTSDSIQERVSLLITKQVTADANIAN